MAKSRLDLILNAQSAIQQSQQFQKALQGVSVEAKKAQAALDSVGKKAANIKFTVSGDKAVQSTLTSLSKSVNTLTSKAHKISFQITGIKGLRTELSSVKKVLDGMSSKNVSVKFSVANFAKTSKDLTKIKNDISKLTNKSIMVNFSSKGIKELRDNVKSLRTLLREVSQSSSKISLSSAGFKDLKKDIDVIRTGIAALNKAKPKITVTSTGIPALDVAIKGIVASINTLNKAVINPKVDTKAISKAITSLTSIETRLKAVKESTISIKANIDAVSRLQQALDKIKSTVKEINKLKVDIGSTRGVGNLGSQIKLLQTSIAGMSATMSNVTRSFSTATTSINRSLTSIANAAGTAGGSFAETAGDLGVLGGTFALIGKASGRASGGIGKVGGSIARLGTVTAALGLTGTGTFLAGLVKLADEAQQIENRLKLVTNSTEELIKVQGVLFRQSQDARVDLTAQADLYQRIALSAQNLNASQAEVLAGTEAVAKAITISAASTQAANATIIQFGQALSFGKLRGDELRSVLEQAPRLAQALADGLGLTRGELVKFGFAGKLTSDRVFKALLSQLPKLREEFEKITPRIGESSKTVVNSFRLMAQAMNDVIPVAESTSKSLLGIADSVEKSIPKTLRLLLELRFAWIGLKDVLTIDFEIPVLTRMVDEIGKVQMLIPKLAKLYVNSMGQMGRGIFAEDQAEASASNFRKVLDEAEALRRELRRISVERDKLGTAITAYDAQVALGRAQEMVNGVPNQYNIDLRVNAEKAKKEIDGVRDRFNKIESEFVELEVRVNMEEVERQVAKDRIMLFTMEDKNSEDYKNLETQIALYEKYIQKVKDEGTAIVATTEAEKARLKATQDALNAIKASITVLPESIKIPAPQTKEESVGGRDPDADARRLQQYIDKMRQAIAVTGELSAEEAALAELRADAGDEAVSKIEDVVRAYEAVNEAQNQKSDFLDDLKDRVNKLKEEKESLRDITEVERVREEIASRGVRSKDEQDTYEAIMAQLSAIQNLDQAMQQNAAVAAKVAELRRLSVMFAPEEAELARTYAKQTDQLIMQNKLQAARTSYFEKIKDITDSTIDESKTDKDRTSEKIKDLEEFIKLANQTPVETRPPELTDKLLADAIKSVELLKEAQGIVVDFGITTESLIRDTAQAMADTMSEYFFRVMQGDFENLTDDMADKFKKAIDRMVADALAAKLAETVMNGFASFGGGLLGGLKAGLFGTGSQTLGSVSSAATLPSSVTFTPAQFGAETRTGMFHRVNEIGMESFVDRSGQRSLIDAPRSGLFQSPKDGRIETASQTKNVVQYMSSGPMTGPVQPSMDLASLMSDVAMQPPPLPRSSAAGAVRPRSGLSLGTLVGGPNGGSLLGSIAGPLSGGGGILGGLLGGGNTSGMSKQEYIDSLPDGSLLKFMANTFAGGGGESSGEGGLLSALSSMFVGGGGEPSGDGGILKDLSNMLSVTDPSRMQGPLEMQVDGKSYLKMGSESGRILSNHDLREMLSRNKIPGRRLGGRVSANSLYEVGEAGKELLSIGKDDFMSRHGVGSSSNQSEVSERVPSVMNVSMNISSPDPDGFRKSRGQIQSEMGRAASMAQRRLL